ncbi:Cell division protein BolA [Paramagnetospirillum magnetotacticum MS-1]|uniref:Cell division protein BolA n=1 Tax=Paramagnetospirillum magnetotacticum MS-1 TaxID=272627 RepID=A0A0C2UE46_PARME|nr:BolA family protein [Paramagnetospirillum magnetotacticum]KIL99782.1 Cell division protein BolA [Paramagnetospirillum magnetotacticum MS-1]
MLVAEIMKRKIEEALKPTRLDVADDSQRHAGHAGHHPGGESHFTVTIVSAAFEGVGRIERHRKVNALLAEELAGRVHALALTLMTPDEEARRL